MGEEKRQYVRWKDKIQATYAVGEGRQPQIQRKVFTEDVSETGVLLNTFEELKLGQYVQLSLEFVYDSVPIVLTAKVTHVKMSEDHYKVGLEYVKVDEFQKQRFMRYLELVRKEHGLRVE